MRELWRNRRDFFQNITIVLLALLAVLLLAQTQLYSLGASSGAGYLRYLLNSGDVPLSGDDPAGLLASFPAPVRVAVTGVFEGRYGSVTMTTGDEAFEPLGGLLREALGSAQPFEQCAAQDFLQALTASSVYCDFLNPLPLSVAAGLASWSWEEDGVLIRRLAVAGGESDVVYLYVWDGAETCLRCATAVSVSELDRIVNGYEFNGAMFAFDDGGLDSLAPCSLLPTDLSSLPSLTAVSSLPNTETLLSSLGFYPRTNSRYPEPDGTEVITEGSRILRVGADGVVRYRAGGEDALSISAAGETPTITEAAAGAWTLLNSLLAPYTGEASLYLESVVQTDAGTALTFGCQVNGIPVRSTDGSSAAQVVLSGRVVTSLTLRFRQYASTGEDTPLLPLRQVLGIAAAQAGAELSIGYAESGGVVTAQWLAV